MASYPQLRLATRRAGLGTLAVSLAATVAAGTFTAFGPQTYVKGRGRPTPVVSDFTVLNTNTSYVLRARRGNGTRRFLSAVITLNGMQVLGRYAVFSSDGTIERPVTLSASNRLSVKVVGTAGRAIFVEIIGTDNDPPTISAQASPAPNANNWNNSPVDVTFACADATSGIAMCPGPVTVTSEGAGQVVAGTAVDKAGNTADASVTLNIDRTPPSVTATQSPDPNAAGWNNTSVAVSFAATDGLSGVDPATVSPPVTLTAEGAGQSATGEAADLAGNVGATTLTGIRIDKSPPHLQVDTPTEGDVVATSPVTVSGSVTDGLSGVASVACSGAPAALPRPTRPRMRSLRPGAVGPDFSCDVPLVEGDNVITVEAFDVAGKRAVVTRSVRLEAGGGDTTPPTIHVTSPVSGGFAFHSRPPIDLTYSDASGVDTSTLALSANGTAILVDCGLTATGGRCTPIMPLSDGSTTIRATVRDTAGNEGATESTFTVDAAPVEVQITSPETGLMTQAPTIAVQGTVSAGVTSVEVNGVPASLGGGSFTVEVPLRQGVNMVVAVGRKDNGKTGTHTVDVTRDLVAPIVRIDSPRDAFVSTNEVITVTGLVNDVVSGGRDAVVTVNGQTAQVSNGSFLLMELRLVRGPNRIEAVGTDFVGNVGRHEITVTFQPPVGLRLSMLSGNAQQAPVRETLAEPLTVVVKDAVGNPVAGRVVRFAVTRNNGTLRAPGGDAGEREVQVPTDGSGRASVEFTLGDTTGEGTNRAAAKALGVAGEVEFCATGQPAPPQKILMTNGDNQRGAVGQPLATPLEALVIDPDGNPLASVEVTFRVVLGNGHLDGSDTAVRTTGTDGLVRVVLTLSTEPGINNNVVSAEFGGLTGLPATFTSSGLIPGDPAATSFSGVVLDNAHAAIPGATISIAGTSLTTTTDAQGQFSLPDVPVGHIHLRINPATSPRPETFPPLEFETVTIAGQRNVLGQPILIPAINPNCTVVGGSQDVTVAMQGVPGLTLTVFKNSVTARDGSRTACITISQVHLDKVPMAPPSGTIFMPAWTIQPAGTHFNPPARISIPNDGMPAGRMVDIFQFDHDLNQFINVGKGTTTEDGLLIVSDPGFGITGAGWGGRGRRQPPTTCTESCNDGKECTTDGCQGGSCAHTPVTSPQTKANGCRGCNNGTPVRPQTPKECCDTGAANDPQNTKGGYVVCCSGSQAACTGKGFDGTSTAMVELRKCAVKHEQKHFEHTTCPTGAEECKTTGPLGPKPGQSRGDAECEGSMVEVACLQSATCGTDAACQNAVAKRIVQIKAFGNGHKAGCFPP